MKARRHSDLCWVCGDILSSSHRTISVEGEKFVIPPNLILKGKYRSTIWCASCAISKHKEMRMKAIAGAVIPAHTVAVLNLSPLPPKKHFPKARDPYKVRIPSSPRAPRIDFSNAIEV